MALSGLAIWLATLLGPMKPSRFKLGRHRISRNRVVELAYQYVARSPTRRNNRHDRDRWLKAFAMVVAVASDALMEGAMGRALTVLCEMISLHDAMKLCYPLRLSDLVSITVGNGYGLTVGDTIRMSSTGLLPEGLSPNVDYRVSAVQQDVFQLLVAPDQEISTGDAIVMGNDGLAHARADAEALPRVGVAEGTSEDGAIVTVRLD